MSPSNVASRLSSLWRSLDEKSKARYKREAVRLHNEFFIPTNQRLKPEVTSHQDDTPQAITLYLPHLSADFLNGAVFQEPFFLQAVQRAPAPPAPPKSAPRAAPAKAMTRRFNSKGIRKGSTEIDHRIRFFVLDRAIRGDGSDPMLQSRRGNGRRGGQNERNGSLLNSAFSDLFDHPDR
jgi:hypothetical protein